MGGESGVNAFVPPASLSDVDERTVFAVHKHSSGLSSLFSLFIFHLFLGILLTHFFVLRLWFFFITS